VKRLLQVVAGIMLIPFIIVAVVGSLVSSLARKIIDLALEKVFWI